MSVLSYFLIVYIKTVESVSLNSKSGVSVFVLEVTQDCTGGKKKSSNQPELYQDDKTLIRDCMCLPHTALLAYGC